MKLRDVINIIETDDIPNDNEYYAVDSHDDVIMGGVITGRPLSACLIGGVAYHTRNTIDKVLHEFSKIPDPAPIPSHFRETLVDDINDRINQGDPDKAEAAAVLRDKYAEYLDMELDL